MKKKIAILSGSGISQPSGLETFRGNTGLWNNHNVNDIATFKGFLNSPLLVHNFYNEVRGKINNAQPNLAHRLIADLEEDYEVDIFTQNIDDLHERAGSTSVYHLHGVHNRMKCLSCAEKFDHRNNWSMESFCPACYDDWKQVRPDIVWFGESLDFEIFNKTEDKIREADLFLQIGTSGLVQPVCNLFKRAKPRKKRVEVNMVRSNPRRPFNFHAYYIGDVVKSIPTLVEDIEYLMTYPETPTNKIF